MKIPLLVEIDNDTLYALGCRINAEMTVRACRRAWAKQKEHLERSRAAKKREARKRKEQHEHKH